MTTVYIVLGVLIALVLLYILFKNGAKESLKRVDWYNNWALKVGLSHSSEKHFMSRLNTVSGKLEGCEVKIFEEISSNHESPYLHTYMRFDPFPFNFEFEISRKSLGGKSNFESGDPSVDSLFSFLTNDAEQFQKLLNADVLDKLKLTHPFFGNGLRAETEKFEHYFMGGLTKEAQTSELEAILDIMTALIKASK